MKQSNFLSDPKIAVVVLDEITYMINYKYLDEAEIYWKSH